ncbi:MAG: hypothetical protein R6T93_04970 [Trueperaceae bacterium]
MTAIGWLRRRTLARATRGYVVWVGRAVGWWTIGYLVFWLLVFVTAGVESLPRSDAPPAAPLAAIAGALAGVSFLALFVAGRTPNVVLDRRDLYRLGLAPAAPGDVLGLRLAERRLWRAAIGAAAGGTWSLVAPALFHLHAPWAAPAMALLAVAHADLGWLRYAGFRRTDGEGRAARAAANWGILGAAVLAAAGAAPGPWGALGLAGALTSAHPGTLLLPAALAAAGVVLVRRSLASSWPPRFAAQSLVLTQLQAMRTLRLLAGVAGMVSGREADAAERERLLATLHDRPGATRPRRSLRPPALDRRPWRALAWRAASSLVRRRVFAQLRTVVWSVGAVAAGWAAAPALIGDRLPAGGVPGVAQPAVAADPLGAAFVAALGVLGGAWLLARAGAALLGPDLPRGTVPVEATERTRGRLAVPVVVLTLAAVPAYALASALRGWIGLGAAGHDPLLTSLALAALLLTVLVALEKYATWTGVAAGAWEATLVAALVATLPSLLLGVFGVPGAALPLQLVLLTLLWWVPV